MKENKCRLLQWTDEMNQTLLECKRKAQQMVKDKDPGAMDGNRKKGYMELMKELFDQHGYEQLDLSRQNLRDQAARLEKSLGDTAGNISHKTGKRQSNVIERNDAENIVNIDNAWTEQNSNETDEETNLHTNQISIPPGPVQCQQSEEERALIKKALQIFELGYTQPGNTKTARMIQEPKENQQKRTLI